MIILFVRVYFALKIVYCKIKKYNNTSVEILFVWIDSFIQFLLTLAVNLTFTSSIILDSRSLNSYFQDVYLEEFGGF